MSYLKRAEMVSGVGVGAVGLLGIIGAFLLPVRTNNITLSQNGQIVGHLQQNVWLLQEVGAPKAASMLATLGVLALVVAIAALLHVSHHLAIDLAALWGTAALLVGTVYITSSWTSYLFLPAALLAVVSGVIASIYQVRSRNRNPSSRPGPGGEDR